MTIIVETGLAAANSESYCSVAYSVAYHAARGNSTWATITLEQQEQALRRATDYLEQTYRDAWQGLRVNSTQALSFPRHSVFIDGYVTSSTAIPTILVNATAELALKAAAGELLADNERSVLREKVGVLEVEYDPYSAQDKRYTSVEKMLKPLLANQSKLYVGLNRA